MRGPSGGGCGRRPAPPPPPPAPRRLVHILPPGTGRDFYSGRAPLPPPFGAGPAGQTDGRTDLLPKHNSTSSPERRTSTRRINATLDRTQSVGWCVRGWTHTAGGAGRVAGVGGAGWIGPGRACSLLTPPWGHPAALGSGALRVHVPFCKSGFTRPRGTPPPPKAKQFPPPSPKVNLLSAGVAGAPASRVKPGPAQGGSGMAGSGMARVVQEGLESRGRPEVPPLYLGAPAALASALDAGGEKWN